MTIGSWVRRPDQKWHRVESVIADEPVTHCGRRLKTRRLRNGFVFAFEELLVLDALAGAVCKRCV